MELEYMSMPQLIYLELKVSVVTQNAHTCQLLGSVRGLDSGIVMLVVKDSDVNLPKIFGNPKIEKFGRKFPKNSQVMFFIISSNS